MPLGSGARQEGTRWDGPASGAVPVGVEVAQGEHHVAAHGAHDGPLAATPLDEDGWEEHGGQEDRGVECAERRHPQALLTVEAALWRKDEASEEGDPLRELGGVRRQDMAECWPQAQGQLKP